ncbi:MAG: M20 family metallopeptidase [Chloroflexi bacterium]|nr:M20 family metallopeptidase [Chloroflexota bacterium]
MIDSVCLAQSSTLEEAADLTAHLASFRSYPGQEGNVQRAVHRWLVDNGLPAEFMPTADTDNDRPNVVARIENGVGPTLLFNGHVDTVLAAQGWSCDPWLGRRDGNRFYGLGAVGMKSGVAATMLAVRALAQRKDLWRGTVIFTSVVDEEAYSIGAKALVRAGYKADACIVAEPSFDRICVGGVGKVLVRGDVIGRASHGSQPELGINSAIEGAKLLARLDSMQLGQHPRMRSSQSVLSYMSGSDQYVITVPEKARFTINRHIVPGETDESVLAEMDALAELLGSPARFQFSIDPPYYPPWETPTDHPMVQLLTAVYRDETGRTPGYRYSTGVADANYFSADLGIPTVYFGPLGDGLHQKDEWVDLETVAACVRIYLRFALEFMR